MQRRLRLLAALLVIAVMHNAVSASPIAPDSGRDAAGHAHHGHDSMKGDDSGDCCDSGSCDCGCAATPPAAASRPTPVARDWARIASIRADDVTGNLPGHTGAPFRPPA